MQEIAVGVYVGNFNSRVREELWKHICDNVTKGEATISYAARNEIGYTFDSYQTKQEVFELDGIPLVRYPVHQRTEPSEENYGFSKAYHSHILHKLEKRSNRENQTQEKSSDSIPAYILLDLETTGLDEEKNQIIEIGALKVQGEHKEEFHRFLRTDEDMPQFITDLTGITMQMLVSEGIDRKEGMQELADFLGNMILAGYNIKFDIKFLEAEYHRLGGRLETERIY